MKLMRVTTFSPRFLCLVMVFFSAVYLCTQLSCFERVRSQVVMKVCSLYESRHGLGAEAGIQLLISAGDGQEDWSSQIMVFNDDPGFSAFLGRPARLTIYYNFGTFASGNKYSSFYDERSAYFNAFYGGYMIREAGYSFGFDSESQINTEELFTVPAFDIQQLVMASLGCPYNQRLAEPVWDTLKVTPGTMYLGEEGWVKADCQLTVNSPLHCSVEKLRGYWQFGSPPPFSGEDFAPVLMCGRFYVRYEKEYDCTIILYIMMKEQEDLEKCDREILSKSVLERGGEG